MSVPDYSMSLQRQAEIAYGSTGDFYQALNALKAVGWSERPAARAIAAVQRNAGIAA